MSFRKSGWVAVFVLSLACVGNAAIVPPQLPVADPSWEKVIEVDGVKVHKKDIPDSDVVAFRGETIYDAPIARVANVLIDTSRKLEWVSKCVEAKDIRQNGPFERVEYNKTASGFFAVKDRDFVFHAKAELNREKQQMIIRMKSVSDPLAPETGSVRGELKQSTYTLTSLDGGRKTHLVVEIQADPKGSVPKWLVNLFQRSWPRKTLEGIREQLQKPDVVEHPGVKAFFEGKKTAA